MSLPSETLFAVCATLSPSSLATLARVSVRFNSIAERVLYSSIIVFDDRTIIWAEALKRRPHLLDIVRRVQIRWTTPPQYHHQLLDICERVNNVLRYCVSLDALELLVGPANLAIGTGSIHPIERIVHGCAFPNLRTCSLGAEWAKGAQTYSNTLVAFLSRLPAVTALRISDLRGSTLEMLPPTALPLLASFRGTADAAASLLPGRPVHHLALVGQDSDVGRENLVRFTFTRTPLKHLDLAAMTIRPMLLRIISAHLPSLESLRIRFALRHTLHYAFTGIVSCFPALPVYNWTQTSHRGSSQA